MATLSVQPNPRVTFAVQRSDDDLLVVRKPAGVVTQPGVGHEHDTLLNGLFHAYGERLQQLGHARDFGLVHRLDRETSGLLVVALSARAYDALRAAFAERRVEKYYWAISHKPPRDETGVIKRAIVEEERKRSRYTSEKRASVSAAGKPAATAYRVLDTSELGALIEARPLTGRLHQVRVHLASVGAGILGDALYGPVRTSKASHRLALHAHRLAFEHPVTGAAIDERTSFPKDLRRLLRTLGLTRPDVDQQAPSDDDD